MPKQASKQAVGDFSHPSVIPFSSNVALETLSLSALADNCKREIEKYRRKEAYNDQYCLEIFHRAMVKHDLDAWELLQKRFSPIVKAWMRNHSQRYVACRHQTEEDYVDETFVRIWQASIRNTLEFGSMAAALRYLKLCLQGAVIDSLQPILVQENCHFPILAQIIILWRSRQPRMITRVTICGKQLRACFQISVSAGLPISSISVV